MVAFGGGDVDSLLLDDALEFIVGQEAVPIAVRSPKSFLEEEEAFGALGGQSLLDPQDDRFDLSHFLAGDLFH